MPHHYLILIALFILQAAPTTFGIGFNIASCPTSSSFFDYRVVKSDFDINCEDITNHADFDTGTVIVTKIVAITINITTETRLPCNEEQSPSEENYLYFSNFDPTLRLRGNCNETKNVFVSQ
eukprot:Awhi_evm1s3651